PARAAERVEAASTESIRILSAQRHTNKLKTGHLKGNKFSILLREPASDVSAEAASKPGTRFQIAERIVTRLRAVGVPNYYGEQRFGIGGETASLGFDLLRGHKSTRDIPHAKRKFLLRLALSAAQSELFNTALADRMSREQLRTVLVGDVMRKSSTGGLFTTTDAAAEQPRLDAGELQITGPMFGPKMQPPQAEPADREAALLKDAGLAIEDFSRYPKLTSGARRPYLIDVSDLKVSAEADGLRFDFILPAGAYATVLLREIAKQA
nr:tRNA pseudouridine(13) synthase TruD [Planctomycetota bacterium]